MKYTKILVPTDFSDCSKQALRYAEGLALRDEATRTAGSPTRRGASLASMRRPLTAPQTPATSRTV